MTEEEKETLYTDINELLDIFNQFCPIQANGTYVLESIKPCVTEMTGYIVRDKNESASLLDWLDSSDFWTAPASTRFHGNFKAGLSLHTLKVIQQALLLARPIMENFWTSPMAEKYSVTAEDIFVAALVHDFCKTDFYGVEYRNTKDITGNWIKQPYYKSKGENRNLGHGNESVLKLLEIMPSYIKKRHVLEAVSRHMGFSDLSESESYNYSNFLQNPLVVLIQIADETAAQWYNC
jgi:hypothetical protein